jgi:SAM-dependent methyltransferase
MAEEKNLKEQIRGFWNQKPCGTFGNAPENPDKGYFEKIRSRRYKLEPFIKEMADFESWRGKKVLEIGCGVGTDGVEFAKAGAVYTGIDASSKSAELAKKNFKLSGFNPDSIVLADAENLLFKDNTFDFVYSWGVIHHTPDMEKAISEVRRVLKDGGKFCIMLYNSNSLVGFQLWFFYGLLRGKPFTGLKKLFSEHHESPDTKAFGFKKTLDFFRDFKNVSAKTFLTPYDLRISRNVFLPKFFGNFFPDCLGFFRVIRGKK